MNQSVNLCQKCNVYHKPQLACVTQFVAAIKDAAARRNSMRSDLAAGLEARHLELTRDQRVGYSPGAHDPRLDRLAESARQAYAAGIISYLPEWSRNDA